MWVTGKVSIPVQENKFNLGVGILAATMLGESQTEMGITYGVATLSSKDTNFSFGLGYGFSVDGWAKSPIITFSGMIRTGRTIL